MRVPGPTLALLDHAAAALHQTRTEFVLQAAAEKARGLLQDRVLVELSDADFEAFQAALDNPPAPTGSLEKLARRKPLWER